MKPSSSARSRPTLVASVARVFDLSLGQLLWSRRSLFFAVLVSAPVLLAALVRLATGTDGETLLRINGERSGGTALFGLMIWLLYIRFTVPALGLFYGTALIADEVEDKTITYLFSRPISRASVLLGKYFAFLACTTLLVLPSVVLVYFLVVPIGGGSIGEAFPALMADLGTLVAGLITYGALFAWVGSRMNRPLVVGLLFAFGWEPVVLLFPGYASRLTVSYYLQALVPHSMPIETTMSLITVTVHETPSPAASLVSLAAISIGALWLAARAVERGEYVLDQ